MEQTIPKNICCVGEIQNDKKIFVEEYVVSFLTETIEKKAEPQMIVFYGDGYEKDGCRYYFLRGAASHRASGDKFGKMDEFYFRTVNKKYFPELKGIGWYCTKNANGQKEILKILQNICEQNFCDIKGYYIYFEKNPEMEEYILYHRQSGKSDTHVTKQKENEKSKVKEKIFQADTKKPQKKKPYMKKESGKPAVGKITPVFAMQVLNMVSLCILIICCIIAVTTLNQYDKMKQLEKTVNYLEISMEEQKNLPEE